MYVDTSGNASFNAARLISAQFDAQVRAGGAAAAPAAPAPRFDAGDLYGKGGPTARDIKQDDLGDCFFVATLGAMANQNPQAIRDAISYDARTGNFSVRLYEGGRERTVTVTQADLAYNVQRNGGSSIDNTGRDCPAWPAVMETGFAKLHDSNHANGLQQGFDVISGGGKARDALATLTGDNGTDITYSKGIFESQNAAIDRLGKQIDAALGNGRPLTLSTDPERRSLWEMAFGGEKQDGLVDNHVYVVEGVRKAGDDYMVTLRNPWGTNSGVEGGNVRGATIEVSLKTLVDTGGLEYLNAGAAR